MFSLALVASRLPAADAIEVEQTFVPAGKPQFWPGGREADWVPVERQRLNDLLGAISRETSGVRAVPFQRAEYTARFDANTLRLADGSARLTLSPDSFTSGQFAEVGPLSVNVTSARWNGQEDQPALLGTDHLGRHQLLLPPAVSEFSFDWSLIGRRRVSGIEFQLSLPPAVVSTLKLTLPTGWTMASSVGVVSEADSAKGVFDIELGMQRAFRLTLFKTGSQPREASVGATTCSMLSRFAIRSGQISGESDIAFQHLAPDTAQISVVVPADLKVQSVEQANAGAVDFRTEPMASGRLRRLIIQPADMIVPDAAFVVRSEGTLPQSGVTSLLLPRAENAVLLEGRLAVTVEGPDRIQSYSPTGLRQRSVSFDGDNQQIAFDQVQSPAELRLRVSRSAFQRRPGLSIRQAAVLDSTAELPALTAELDVIPQRPGVFAMACLVPRGCEITSVEHITETQPERLTWAVLPGTASHGRLVISVPEGFPEAGLQLRVQGQYPDSSQMSLALPALLPLGARSASIAIAVLSETGAFTPQGDSVELDSLPVDEIDNTLSWSPTLRPFFTQTRQRWFVEYRNRPGELASIRLQNVQGSEPESGTPDGAGGNAAAAPDEPVRPRENRAVEVPAGGGTDTPVVVTTLRSQANPGSSGRDHHLISWRFLYASHNQTFSFELPGGSHVLAVTWNGESLGVASDSDRAIAIPQAQPGDTLSIEYTLSSSRVVVVGPLNVPVPKADVLSVGFESLLLAPREYEVLSAEGGTFSTDRSIGGLQWLFGPLARGRGGWPFNPFNAADWLATTGDSGGVNPPDTDVEAGDWHVFTLTSGETPRAVLFQVGQVHQLHALAWFVLAASLLTGLLLRAIEVPHRNRVGFVLVVTGGAIASLLPLPLAEVVGAAVLGICLATLVPRGLVRKPNIELDSMPSTVTLRRLPVGLLLCLLIDLPESDAQTADPPELLEKISILVPYEGNGFLTENVSPIVYIRSTTLRRLVSEANEDDRSAPVSLIRTARWTGAVDEAGDVSLKLRLEASVLSESAPTIELPVAANLMPAGNAIRVNGSPAAYQLSPDGQSVQIELPVQPSTTSDEVAEADASDQWTALVVELDLRPRRTTVAGRQSILVPAVSVPDATVDLKFAKAPVTLTSRGRGLLWAAPDNQTLQVATGPEVELSLDWADQTVAAADEAQLEIGLRSSVEVHDGWLERRSLVAYQAGKSTIRSVAWRLPPGTRISRQTIRALPLNGSTNPTGEIDATPHPQIAGIDIRESSSNVIVTAELDPPATGSFGIVLNWQQFLPTQRRRGLSWAVPVVPGAFTEIQVERHLAGLTTETGLDLAPSLLEAAQALTTDDVEYLDQWPVSEQPRRPRLTLRIDSDVVLEPTVVSIPVQRAVRQSQTARVSRREIEWTVSAEVDTNQGRAFLHRFDVPDEVEVESVTVQEEGVDRLSHWDQRGGAVFLHLQDHTTGIQNVVIEGRQDVPVGREFVIPRMQIPEEDGETVESTLIVYRDPDVIPVITVPNADDNAADQFFVQRFSLTDTSTADVSMTVEVLDTPPSLWAIARLRQDAQQTQVELTLRLDALQLPQSSVTLPGWPIGSEPEISVEGGDRSATVNFDPEASTLQIELHRSLPADISVNVKADLTLPDDDSPLILPPPTAAGLNGQAALISTADSAFRLPGGEPPDAIDLILAEVDPETADAFLIWQADARFESTDQAPPRSAPRPLVVHLIRSGLRNARIAVTQILLQPAEQQDVIVQWPRGIRPLAVYRNGQRPADDAQQAAEFPVRESRIRIPQSTSPTLIEVLWEQTSAGPWLKVQQHDFRLPRVGLTSNPQQDDAQAGRTFLLIAPPQTVTAVEPNPDAQQQATGRFRGALSEWLPILSESASQGSLVGAQATHALWQIGQTLPHTGDDTVDQFLTAMPATRPVGASDLTSGMLPEDHSRLLLDATEIQAEGLWLVDGRLNALLAHIALMLIAIPVITLIFRLTTIELLASRPELSCLVLGLIWWTCLAASSLGFAITVGTVVWMLARIIRKPSPAT